MKIAVISDTHGRVAPVERVKEILAGREIEAVIHCGDVDDAVLVPSLPRGIHVVWGNCDHDRHGIERAVVEIGGTHHGAWGHIKVAGKEIGFVHGDDKRLMNELEVSGSLDYLFYGHTHVPREHRVGKTRVINPGALHRATPKTFVILDVATGEIERFEV